MELRATADGARRSFAGLLLLVLILAAPAAAIWAGHLLWWPLAFPVLAVGLAVAAAAGRRTIGSWRALGTAAAAWAALGAGGFIALVVSVSNCAPELSDPWVVWVGMGVVYAGLGLWSLLTRHSVWGVPLAIMLSVSVGLTLVYTLPGTPTICD
jgi:hypothetical protein